MSWASTQYSAKLSVLAQQVYVAAASAEESAILTVSGEATNNGLSAPVRLGPAGLTLPIDVTAGALHPTYSLQVMKGAPVAQWHYMKPSGAAQFFGTSAAISGDTMLVGASNGVAVFQRVAGTWKAADFPALPTSDGGYGTSVSIDRDIAVVGAPYDAAVPGSGSGAVYVYRRTNGAWSLDTVIHSPDAGSDDDFGYSVSLRNGILLIGAPSESTGGLTNSGVAYIYEAASGSWQQVARIKPTDLVADAEFGWATAVATDGITCYVGAPGMSAAYPVRYDTGHWTAATAWTQPGSFGWSIATDQGAVVIGAPWDTNDTGAAYVYPGGERLVASPAVVDAWFGFAVGISGNVIVVGSFRENGSGRGVDAPHDNLASHAGAAYVFEHPSTWQQTHYLKSLNSETYDQFGFSVAISRDAVVVGAIGEAGSGHGLDPPDDNLAANAGAAYLFQ